MPDLNFLLEWLYCSDGGCYVGDGGRRPFPLKCITESSLISPLKGHWVYTLECDSESSRFFLAEGEAPGGNGMTGKGGEKKQHLLF